VLVIKIGNIFGKDNKRNSNRKKVKLSPFADGMILYLKDLETSTKKFPDIINSISKLAGYKINLQKS
jgi:hypothetical protein